MSTMVQRTSPATMERVYPTKSIDKFPKRTSQTLSRSLSIIIPPCKQTTPLDSLLIRLHSLLHNSHMPHEFILIDDGTLANTVQVVLQQHLSVRVIQQSDSAGRSSTIWQGCQAAKNTVVVIWDADYDIALTTIPLMVRKLIHADVIVADTRSPRLLRQHPLGMTNHLLSNGLSRVIFHQDTDITSGIKVFPRSIALSLSPTLAARQFDLALLQAIDNEHLHLVNVRVPHYHPRPQHHRASLGTHVALLPTALSLYARTTAATIGTRIRHIPILPDESATSDQPLPQVDHSRVEAYHHWLQQQVENYDEEREQLNATAYVAEALQSVEIRGEVYHPFAPFNPRYSASQVVTRPQAIVLLLLLAIVISSIALFHIGALVAIIGLITILYVSDMGMNFFLSIRTLKDSPEDHIDDAVVTALQDSPWPRYTVLCPLYKEAEVARQFVRAMQAMDYPKDRLQILFLTEEDDTETRATIRSMKLDAHFEIVTVPDGKPRTKPRACNYGLLRSTGEYVVIYDAEDIPDPLQLKKAVLAFSHHGNDLACVQAKLNFYNPNQNILTRWFTAEYSLLFDIILPGLQWIGAVLPLGGTSNHFRTSVLRSVGAWDLFNVTEDCDLGLRLARYHLRTVVLDSTTEEEANSNVRNWLRQRSRWVKGYMQTYLVYMRDPMSYFHEGRWREFLSLQFFVGGKTAALFISPLMWLLLAIYIIFRPVVGPLFTQLYPTPIFYMGICCLVFGNFFYLYTHLIGCYKRRQFALLKWVFLIPIYWMMMSGAAFIALWQLFVSPFYWEKTQHGLHLAQGVKQASGIRHLDLETSLARLSDTGIHHAITTDMIHE